MHAMVDEGRARQVEMVLDQVESLPTLSPVATRLLSLTSRDDASIAEIVKLIETDPALASRILGLCRRASRGLGDKITTVRRAVVMLGIETVRSSVLSVAVYDVMRQGSSELDRTVASSDPAGAALRQALFDRVGFWKHAVGVACAAELIASQDKRLRVAPDEAFVSGLLHDIGKLALELVLPQSYARVVALAERRQIDSASAERQVLGLDHHSAGHRLSEHWGLPPHVRDVIWLHSQPFASLPDVPHKPLIAVVTTAKALCRQLHIGWSGDFGLPPDAKKVAAQMGISATLMDTIGTPLHDSIIDRFKILGLDDTGGPELLMESLAKANRQLARLAEGVQERAAKAVELERSLAEIQQFHADRGEQSGGISVGEAIGGIGRSAARMLGAGFWSALTPPPQDARGGVWTLRVLGPDGRAVRTQNVANLEDDSPAATALKALEGRGESAIPIALNAALDDAVIELADLRKLRVIPVGSAAGAPALVLVHDREPPERPLHPALLGCWASSLEAARQNEDSRRLGQKLVEFNRALGEAQQKLTETESMARLGEMTAGAAHEMNNPLTIISGRSQLLGARLKDAKDKAAARAIGDAAQQITDLISVMNMVAEPPTPNPRRCEVVPLLRKAIAMAQERTARPPGASAVELHCFEASLSVVIDDDLTLRAAVEVIANALEASASGVLCRAEMDEAENALIISVEDRGPGFSNRALQHAFDPFFSEKPAGRQRGLGLTKAKRLIEAQGGRVLLSSRSPSGGNSASAGAVVRLIVPMQRERAPL
jgi:HD-like signal output (HDOD) protein/signal transduction histidine kinase